MPSSSQHPLKGQKSLASFFASTYNKKHHSDAAPQQEHRASRNNVLADAGQIDGAKVAPGDVQHNGDYAKSLKRARPDSPACTDLTDDVESKTPIDTVRCDATDTQHAAREAHVPLRDASRHALAQRKLGLTRQRVVLGQDAGAGRSAANTKYTPLEQQVVELKRQNPGKVLLIEVRTAFLGPPLQKLLPSSWSAKRPCTAQLHPRIRASLDVFTHANDWHVTWHNGGALLTHLCMRSVATSSDSSATMQNWQLPISTSLPTLTTTS